MDENKKPENKENEEFTQAEKNDVAQEMPTVTTLLQRKKLANASPTTDAENPSPEHTTISSQASIELTSQTITPTPAPQPRGAGLGTNVFEKTSLTNTGTGEYTQVQFKSKTNIGPPRFKKKLVLEQLDLIKLEKELKKNKKNSKLKLLDYLGYFSTVVDEILLIQETASHTFKGRVGIGPTALIVQAKTLNFNDPNATELISLLKSASATMIPVTQLQAETQTFLKRSGFTKFNTLVLLPMPSKTGSKHIWMFLTEHFALGPKDRMQLDKLFKNYEL